MCLLADLRRLHHRAHLLTVDLDRHGALLVRDIELLLRLAHVADQGVCRDELRIDHIRSEAFAHQAKSDVGHILHRRQKHGALP